MYNYQVNLPHDLQEIKDMMEKNPLLKLEPLWHTNINEIEDTYLYKPDPESNTIIYDVDVDLLVSKLVCGTLEFLDKSKLFGKYGFKDERTCRVIKNWMEGKRLTPPSIFTESGSQMLKREDGMHRLDTARYFGATRIPIVVNNHSVDKIKKILTTINT